jgi:hypothetical protein
MAKEIRVSGSLFENLRNQSEGVYKMKKVLTICFLLISSTVFAQHVPPFSKARKVIENCYGGWNGTVDVAAGLKSSYTTYEYQDAKSSISTGSSDSFGESLGTSEISNSIDGEVITASSSAEHDLFDSADSSSETWSRDRWTNDAYVGVTIKVPLYSREVRIKRKEDTNKAVGDIADLYAKYDGYAATVQALEKEVVVLRRVMVDTGAQGISTYYSMLVDIEKSKALGIAAERKIITILEGCGYVEKNRTNRKGQSSKKANKAKTSKQKRTGSHR